MLFIAIGSHGRIDIALTHDKPQSIEELNCGLINNVMYAKLSVSDTGKGIPEEMLTKIFDPYFTTKPKGQGTGLGLSIVHGIIKNHRGAVTVQSESGNGTIFNVFIPLIEQDSVSFEPCGDNVLHGSERILLVDDELPLIQMSVNILEFLGYQVTAFTDSLEALQTFMATTRTV